MGPTREIQVCKPISTVILFLKIIQEFISDEGLIRSPASNFRNNIYVYPLRAEFSSSNHRNIAIRVEFMASEGNMSTVEPGLECIASKYSASLERSYTTPVTYHSKVCGIKLSTQTTFNFLDTRLLR